MVRLRRWERWEKGEVGKLGKVGRQSLELDVSFLSVVVGKSKCRKMRRPSKEDILYK